MFMNDYHVEQSITEFYMDDTMTSDALNEASAYETLLNTVDAARSGLASGEHDFDLVEDESI